MSDTIPPAAVCAGEPPLPASAHAHPLSHAIVRVARLHRLLTGQLLRDTGLHPAQELVMMQLWELGPQRQTDLARTLGADPAAITRTVQRLEHAGFVRRTHSERDRRVTIVEASEGSLPLREGVEACWSELERAVTGELDETHRGELVTALRRMEDALANRLEEQDDAPTGGEASRADS